MRRGEARIARAICENVSLVMEGKGNERRDTLRSEDRFYCFGEVQGGILTVRFTYRRSAIRIIGAGYGRKGKAVYERENKISG